MRNSERVIRLPGGWSFFSPYLLSRGWFALFVVYVPVERVEKTVDEVCSSFRFVEVRGARYILLAIASEVFNQAGEIFADFLL